MAASSKTASASSETKLVQELADILDKSGLAELEYETDAVAIRLSRVTGATPVVAPAPVVTAPAGAVTTGAGATTGVAPVTRDKRIATASVSYSSSASPDLSKISANS